MWQTGRPLILPVHERVNTRNRWLPGLDSRLGNEGRNEAFATPILAPPFHTDKTVQRLRDRQGRVYYRNSRNAWVFIKGVSFLSILSWKRERFRIDNVRVSVFARVSSFRCYISPFFAWKKKNESMWDKEVGSVFNILISSLTLLINYWISASTCSTSYINTLYIEFSLSRYYSFT